MPAGGLHATAGLPDIAVVPFPRWRHLGRRRVFLAILCGATAARAAAADDPRSDVPQVDAASVILFADQGRIEMTGHHLEGARLRWQANSQSAGPPQSVPGNKAGANVGEDVCWTPRRPC